MVRGAVAAAVVTAGALPLAAQTRATVYPDGRVFVQRAIAHPLAAGTTVVPLPYDLTLAGSIVALDPGVTINAIVVPQGSDQAALLRRSVGHRVFYRPTPADDTTSALVLSFDPPRYRLTNGLVVTGLPGGVLFPPEVTSGRGPAITVTSRTTRPHLALGYLLHGLSWSAHYVLDLHDDPGTLTLFAILFNESVTLDSADVSLAEGEVPRVIAPPNVRTPDDRARAVLSGVQARATPVRTLRVPGRHALRAGETASLPLTTVSGVSIDRVLRVPGILDARTENLGNFSGATQPLAVTVRYLVPRRAGASFDGPLPPGTARIFGRVRGETTLLSEAQVLVPEADTTLLELLAGTSSEISAFRTVHTGSLVQDTVVSATGNRTVRTVATILEHGVSLANLTDSAVIVEIVERRPQAWSVLSSSVPAEPLGGGGMRFRVRIPPRGETTFHARMRVPIA